MEIESDKEKEKRKIAFSCDKCHLIPLIINFNHSLENGNSIEYCCLNNHSQLKTLKNYIIENQIEIKYYCSLCNKNLNENNVYYSNNLSLFCEECNNKKDKKIKTILIKNILDINFTCFLHNEIFNGYCLDCLVNICEKCKEHNGHNIFYFKDNINSWVLNLKEKVKEAEKFIDNIIKFKEKRLNNNNIYKSNKNIEVIEKIYNNFVIMNKEQILFINNCIDYIKYQNKKLNFQIIENIKTCLQFNFIKIINIEQEYITHDLINLFIEIIKSYSVIRNAEFKKKLSLTQDEKNQIFLNKKQNFNTIPKNLIKQTLPISNIKVNPFYDNQFCTFKSLRNEDIIVYHNGPEIIIFNINTLQKITHLKNFNKEIRCIRHYIDYKRKKDIIITCGLDNQIVLFDLYSVENILIINNVCDKNYYVLSVCMIFDIQNYFIINSSLFDNYLKIWDSKGNLIGKLNDTNNVCFLDTYFDRKLAKYFIIIGTRNGSKSFDFEKKSLYLQYSFTESYSIITTELNGESILIESNYKSNYIFIYDFHKGDIVKEYYTYNNFNLGLCLWNSKFIFQCSSRKNDSLFGINLENDEIINFNGFNSYISCQKNDINGIGYCLIAISNNDIIDLLIDSE